jgi:hypothetical protein
MKRFAAGLFAGATLALVALAWDIDWKAIR